MSQEPDDDGEDLSEESKRKKVSMGRALGASPAARKAMAEANDAMQWFGNCRKCGAELKGTPPELRQHKCEDV